MDIQLLREVSDFLEEYYYDEQYEEELCGELIIDECCEECEIEEPVKESVSYSIPVHESRSVQASKPVQESKPAQAFKPAAPEGFGGGIPPFVPEKNFADTLFGFIDARGITDGQAANCSGIDRRLMSKIRNNPNHTPTKKTIFSFAIGLRLSEEETEELLMKAGYAFSNSSRFDLILQYFIRKGNYDIWEINEVLHYYGLEPVCC